MRERGRQEQVGGEVILDLSIKNSESTFVLQCKIMSASMVTKQVISLLLPSDLLSHAGNLQTMSIAKQASSKGNTKDILKSNFIIFL